MKLVSLEEIMNTFSEEDRSEIEKNAKKMIEDYKLQLLYNQLSEYQQSLAKQDDFLPTDNELEITIHTLSDYVKSMGGTIDININLPTGKHLTTTL